MFDKKATGLYWDAAMLALVISVGMLIYYSANTNVPKIGEFSLNAVKALENGNNIPITVEIAMEELNKASTDNFDNNKAFKLKSYCENAVYKNSLTEKQFTPPAWLSKRAEAKCLVDGEELGNYYWEAFDG